jgi:hypothetical protein
VSVRNKLLTAVLLGLLAVVSAYVIYELTPIKKDMTDFGVCYQAGERILGGEILYRSSDGHLQYKYSPVSALFFSAFTVLPYEAARIVWYYLEWILLGGIFYFSIAILPVKNTKTTYLVGFAALIVAKFIGREFQLGQVNTLIIFLLVVSLAGSIRGRFVGAGVAYGLTLFLKPYALIFFPYYLLKKRFKLIGAGSATLLLGLLLPALLYGFRGNLLILKEWISTLSLSTPGLLTVGDNASLYAFVFKHIRREAQTLDWLFVLLVVFFLALALLEMMRIGRTADLHRPEALEASFLFVLIPFLSPLGWYYNYLYSVPAVVLLLNSLSVFQPFWKYLLVADFVMIGGSLREVLGKAIFRFYTHESLVVINFLVVILCLYYARTKRYC